MLSLTRSLFLLSLIVGSGQLKAGYNQYSALGEYLSKNSTHTRALVVWQDGANRFEFYSDGKQAHTRQLSWSMAKSYLNYLVYVGVNLGYLGLDDSICRHLKVEAQFCPIEVRDLLSMSSGLSWQESYEEDLLDSKVLQMLYGPGSKNVTEFVLSLGIDKRPGDEFEYSSGGSNILAAALKAAVERKSSWDSFKEKAAKIAKLKELPVLEEDASGNWIGSSYMYMKPQSWIDFGRFFLENKKFPHGITKSWRDWSTSTPSSWRTTKPDSIRNNGLGRHWWTNRSVIGDAPWPSLPEDTFAARGHWGQYLAVVPSQKMVILRLADDRNDVLDLEMIASLLKTGKLPQRDPSSISVGINKKGAISRGFKQQILKKLRLQSAFAAKMYCSCLYVEARSKEFCKQYTDTGIIPTILMPVRKQLFKNSTTSGILPYRKRAYLKEGSGCHL